MQTNSELYFTRHLLKCLGGKDTGFRSFTLKSVRSTTAVWTEGGQVRGEARRQPVKCRIFTEGEFAQLSASLTHLTHTGGENPGAAVPCAAGACRVPFSPSLPPAPCRRRGGSSKLLHSTQLSASWTPDPLGLLPHLANP